MRRGCMRKPMRCRTPMQLEIQHGRSRSAVELEVLCLNQEHEQVHAAAGRQMRITAGPAKGGRLFWPAAQTDSRRQAQALLAQAR